MVADRQHTQNGLRGGRAILPLPTTKNKTRRHIPRLPRYHLIYYNKTLEGGKMPDKKSYPVILDCCYDCKTKNECTRSFDVLVNCREVKAQSKKNHPIETSK
jgi:hypothetical protein